MPNRQKPGARAERRPSASVERDGAAEAELREVRASYSSALDRVEIAASTLRDGAKLLLDSHNASLRGEVMRHRLGLRLGTLKAFRVLSFVSADLRRRVEAARGVELDLPESSAEALSRFLEKLGSAMELLDSAGDELSSARRSAKKLPPEIMSLVRAASTASSVLGRLSRRSRALVSSHAGSALDDGGPFD